MKRIDEICVNTLRFLAVDAIEKAHSGHPGMPLGAAPAAYTLWHRHLRFDPDGTSWFNRDRFILSAGHASALLYALLHCFGFDLGLEDLKAFRQWGSRTPGHPEHGLTPGVEVTTGPLGQGFAMAVGMSIAETYLGSLFNRPGFPIVDHYTYALVSDGDLMEGISHEAASLAGTLGLAKLICLYDDNDVSIEGSTELCFTENVRERFEAYNWYVAEVRDANDIEAIDKAISQAKKTAQPSLLIIHSHLGYGSPKQDSADAHGAPLGQEAVRETKRNLGWPEEPTFYMPDEAKAHFAKACMRGKEAHGQWLRLLEGYRKRYPENSARFDEIISGILPKGWREAIPRFASADGPIATRVASGKILNAIAIHLPYLIGGSADLAPSTKTLLKDYPDFSRASPNGRNLRFGVREFAMAAILNGMALHGGLLPYGSTFLVFSDYMRPALRLAAMQKAHTIFIFSHDSIAIGEDGPTHQPVEQLMSLRAIPGLTVLRPADANEAAVCWEIAVQREGPVALILTRQNLPVLDTKRYPVEDARRGAYEVSDTDGKPDIILIATGSEVHLALEASRNLAQKKISARVVSMPSWEVFAEQPPSYQQDLLPPHVPKLSIEAGITLGWERFTAPRGDALGLNRFGASAPGRIVYEKLGFNVSEIISRVSKLLRR